MKIMLPIRFLVLWIMLLPSGMLLAVDAVVWEDARPALVILVAPPQPEPWDPDPCLYARASSVSDCLPNIQWEICDCVVEPDTPCCRGKIVSGGTVVGATWVWGVGRGFKQRDWEFAPRRTVYRAPLCPERALDPCGLGPEMEISCGRGWAPHPDAIPCS
jgi:hypothetical protein